jgi:hypothetical protein
VLGGIILADEEEKPVPLKVEVLDKIAALVTAAFGLVAALAWNEAIKTIFKEIFGTADAVAPMLIYAIVVTIIAVFFILFLKLEKNLQEKFKNSLITNQTVRTFQVSSTHAPTTFTPRFQEVITSTHFFM